MPSALQAKEIKAHDSLRGLNSHIECKKFAVVLEALKTAVA
jgi:hypothetical protein